MKTAVTIKKSLNDYEKFADDETLASIRAVSKKLKGAKILHINATAFGGGVAEILHTLVPLMRDCGLRVDWKTIEAPPRFFELTKRMHNALQGKEDSLSSEDKKLFEEVSRANATHVEPDEYDLVVIHDPQPVALPAFADFGKSKLVWRCHIDTSFPNKDFWDYLNSFLVEYDAGVFTLKTYAKHGIEIGRLYEIAPSIDPLSDKNRDLNALELEEAINKLGVDIERPIISQISRFDPWKDPLGVVEVYRKLKREYEDLQLLMIGSMASDDPEGWKIYEDLLRYTGLDYDVKILSNYQGIGNIEVNAAQRISDVVLQKSLREGFALTMSEAMWKKTPVIGGNVGGIPLQVHHGVNGYLVDSIDQAVHYTGKLLRERELARDMGERGYKITKKNFLSTRHLNQYLDLFSELI